MRLRRLFFLWMTLGTGSWSRLGIVLFVEGLVTGDAIVVNRFGVILHLFLLDLILGHLFLSHLFFQLAGHLTGNLVAFDTALDLISHFQVI